MDLDLFKHNNFTVHNQGEEGDGYSIISLMEITGIKDCND